MSRPARPPGLFGPLSWELLTQGPLEFVGGLARRFGPVARFQVGWVRYYVLSHPDHVLQVLQERQDRYSKATHDYWLMSRIMGTSLLTGDGPFWKQRRRLIQPLFQRRQLEHLARQTAESVDTLCRQWERHADDGVGFEGLTELVQLTLRIIGRTLFSTDLVDQAPAVGEAVKTINRTAAWNLDTVISLTPGLNGHIVRAMRCLDDLIAGLVAQRRAEPEPVADLLSALVHARDEETGAPLSDQEIRNEAMTLMLAGHDTTAHHLAWTAYLLAEHPQVVTTWHAELDRVLGGRPPTLADLPQLPYTRMIIEESMRLYPPIWTIPRRVIADDDVGGYRLRRGSYVLLALREIQRDPRWWSEPEAFRPERFDRALHPAPRAGAYAPFGWGPRTCVGAQFATVESQLILATLGQRLTWRVEPGQRIVPEGYITLLPKYGIRLRTARRSPIRAPAIPRGHAG